jgi:hypothetical protein
MIAIVGAHPNIVIIVFYLLASAMLAVALYRFHRRET